MWDINRRVVGSRLGFKQGHRELQILCIVFLYSIPISLLHHKRYSPHITLRQGDDEKELHKEVSNNVHERLTKAMEELKQKHATGTNEIDDVERAPTGSAYKALHMQQRQQAKNAAKARGEQEERERKEMNRAVGDAKERMRRMKFQEDGGGSGGEDGNDDDSDSEEDEFDHLLDEEDPDLVMLRQARIAELKQNAAKLAEHRSLGHGELRTIMQDDFLPECTGSSRYVCIHFFHDDFERCKIMDFHLNIIAKEHIECKFLRIDAAKAPFFVHKLKIKTLPALFVFEDGKEVGRLTGFDGLAMNPKKPDEWHTGRLEEWISETGAIKYVRPGEEVEEERKRLGLVMRGAVYSDRERSGFGEDY